MSNETEKPLAVDVVADVALTSPVTIYAHDPLAVAKNAATNGRLFCIMIAAADIAAGYPVLALLAAVPIGMAALLDPMPASRARSVVHFGAQAFAAVVAFVSLLNIW